MALGCTQLCFDVRRILKISNKPAATEATQEPRCHLIVSTKAEKKYAGNRRAIIHLKNLL